MFAGTPFHIDVDGTDKTGAIDVPIVGNFPSG